MKISEFSFRTFGTGVVLIIALSIAGWIGLSGVWGIVSLLAVITGITLLVGIIA